MPGDVRLGLVFGVGLVIAVAVIAFRKEDAVGGTTGNVQLPAPYSIVPSAPPARRFTRAMAQREHKVLEGETLFSLAVRYYGDGSRSSFLFRANQDRLLAPDRVPAGTVLHIPELPGGSVAPRP